MEVCVKSYWNFAVALMLGGMVTAQDVYVPDVTTVIDGGKIEVVEEAIPDYEITLPERKENPPMEESPLDENLESAPKTVEDLPPSLLALATAPKEKNIFVEGILAPAWPLSLFSKIRVYSQGENPLFLNFSYNTVGGYGLEGIEEGFFHNRSLLLAEKTFTPGLTVLEVGGRYQSQDDGLQGRSLLFDDINRRGAGVHLNLSLPLGYGFSLGGKLPLNWYNRYAGFSNTLGKTEVNGDVALSILDVSPNFHVNWDSKEHTSLPQNHQILAEANFLWDYTASLDPEITSHQNRGSFNLSSTWLWEAVLEVTGNLSLVYFPTGVGSNQQQFLAPFSLGVRYNHQPIEVSETFSEGNLEKSWSVYGRGGLSSHHLNFLQLEEQEPFVDFSPLLLLQYGEQSDWFATVGVEIPFVKIFLFEVETDFRQSAFGNNLLTGNYEGQVNQWTGLFEGEAVARNQLSTKALVTSSFSDFFIRVAWLGQWLYYPEYLAPQNLHATFGYQAPREDWGANVGINFGFGGNDSVPVLNAQAYYKPISNLKLALYLKDMVKLFTGRQRVLIEPYMKEAGSVSVSVEFSF